MNIAAKSETGIPNWGPKYDMSREEALWLSGCSVSERPNPHQPVHAAPLLQIFSVFVSTNFEECQIYGHIRATELKDGTSFDLYNRDSDEYETMLKNGYLSLTGPECDAILGNTKVTIDVCLKDRTRNMDLITGQYHLNCVVDDCRDKLMKAVIEGEHGTVCLYYTIFRYAVYAIVKVAICKSPDSFDEVHGSLVASYSNSRQYCNTDDEVKYLETKLFEKPSDKYVRVADRIPIKLLRCAVVLPAYSSLSIKVDLSSSHGHLASGVVEFFVYEDHSKTISFANGHVKVNVEWETAYHRIYKESVVRRKMTKCSESKTEEPLRKVPQQLVSSKLTSPSDQPLVSSFNPNGKSNIEGWTGVEIFTVYVGGINHEVSTLYGSIKVNYGYTGYFDIYKRSGNEAEPLLDDNTVCIELHEAIKNSSLNIIVDLKNPNQDREISWCEIGWNCGMMKGGHGVIWFDKRVCTVARGESGYAALHYMIIKNGVRATLEVSLICDDNVVADVPPNIYGLICARYGGHNYSTEYEKLYYKSRLFNKQRHNPEKPSGRDLRVRLIKSVMLVPSNSQLIIEADLKLICNDNSDEETVFGEQDFSIDLSETTHKVIGKGAYRIKVSVLYHAHIN